MIILRGISFFATLSIVWLQVLPVQSATYFVSPTGSDSNPGTSEKPWLTFAYAIDSARASCGDTLALKDGTYGDGTRTGKVAIKSLACRAGYEFVLIAENQRQAKIFDNGTGKAVSITNSAHIIVDGLYARSMDNIGSKSAASGSPFFTSGNNHITLKNLVARNPNRYANSHGISVQNSQDILVEDSEVYVFHRHCVLAWQSTHVVVRRQYCNARGGMIPGGFGISKNPVATAGAVVSLYPCRDCIVENSIADGTTTPFFLIEMNATFGAGMLMKGSKVLGSICYKCNYGNGLYLNSRSVADTNHSPQDITIRDIAILEQGSAAAALRCSDCMNVVVDHVTVLGNGAGVTGILGDDSALGSGPVTNSMTITNSLVTGMTGSGFKISNYDLWSGNKLISYNNGTSFKPSLPSNWANTQLTNPQLGSCMAWIPSSSPLSGKGTGGSDIGATILYRYVNGNLTSTPLWDPRTGEFPHGAPDLDGTNRVAGESLFDIHKRLNVNTRDCPFPKDYGNSDSDKKEPASPVGLMVS